MPILIDLVGMAMKKATGMSWHPSPTKVWRQNMPRKSAKRNCGEDCGHAL